MSKSLVLSILVILLASSVTAKFQQKGPVRGCMSMIGDGFAEPDCDAECKLLHTNPGEEPSGNIANIGTSPPLCFCSYRCGGTISETCRWPTGSLIKDDKKVDQGCDDLCRGGYPNGSGIVSKYEFGDICQCDFDC